MVARRRSSRSDPASSRGERAPSDTARIRRRSSSSVSDERSRQSFRRDRVAGRPARSKVVAPGCIDRAGRDGIRTPRAVAESQSYINVFAKSALPRAEPLLSKETLPRAGCYRPGSVGNRRRGRAPLPGAVVRRSRAARDHSQATGRVLEAGEHPATISVSAQLGLTYMRLISATPSPSRRIPPQATSSSPS